jgi:cell division protease FtsH
MTSNGSKQPIDMLMAMLRSLFGSRDDTKKKDGLPPKARFSIWYFVFAMLFLSYLQPLFFSSKVETIPYSQFKQYVADGYVGQVTIGSENIKGALKGDVTKKFNTIRVNDPDLVKDLDAHKVGYAGSYESKFLGAILSWVIPIGLFFLIWRFAMKKMGPGMGVMSFSKSKAN